MPAVTLQAFRTAIMAALREYFVGEDGFEVMRVVDELQSPALHYEGRKGSLEGRVVSVVTS